MRNLKDVEIENLINDYKNNLHLTLAELQSKYKISRKELSFYLKENNIPEVKQNRNLIPCNEDYFETIDTPAKAYYLGFIAGDGYLSKDGKTLAIQLNINDKEILDGFLKELDSEHPIYEAGVFDNRTNKTYYHCAISIWRKKLCSDLQKHNVGPNKSFDLKLPNIDDNLMCHYIRGILDSDGCWSLAKQKNTKGKIIEGIRMTFAISVYSFAEELQDFLIKKCNLNKTKIQIKTDKLCVVAYVGKIQCKRIYDYVYGKGGPWLNRKYEFATSYFNNDKIVSDANEIKRSKTHNRTKFLTKECLCEICRLCNLIYLKFRHSGIYLDLNTTTNLSTKYINLYNEDKTYKKISFYKILTEEVDKLEITKSIKNNITKEIEIEEPDNIVVPELKPKEPSFLNQLLGFKS
jgi:hypothetical protein